MNEYADRHSSSSGTAVALVVVLVLVVVGGLIVAAGAAVLVFRANAAQRESVMARQQAMLAAERAQRALVDTTAELEVETPPENTAAGRTIKLSLDGQGNIQLVGSDVPLPELQEQLGEEIDAWPVTIELTVDGQCQFQHVTDVMRICRECGVSDIRFAEQHR